MNIESIKRRLLVKYPHFGSIVANSNFIIEPSVRKVDTDGKNIYYNPNFIKSITDEEQIFVFAHQICHIAFNHILRSEGKDKEIWNIATDSVVNALLKQDGLSIVEGEVDIPEAINYDAEEMYNKLLSKKHMQQQSIKQDDNNQNKQCSSESSLNLEQDKMNIEKQGESRDIKNDIHSMWDKAIEKEHQEKQLKPDLKNSIYKHKDKQSLFDKLRKIFSKKKCSRKNDNNTIKKSKQDQENEKNEIIKKLVDLGEKEGFNQNKIERKKQLEELKKTLINQSHGYGNDTNSEIRNITDIGTSKPLIDWRKLLREAAKYDVDWSYQNGEIEDGVVTAYLEEIPKSETEIVLDTSGSIDEILLRNFLRECKNILQTSKIKVGCFDTEFYGFTEIKDASDIDNLQFYGGGGTDFDVAVSAFTKRVENKIIFTDGHAPMPKTSTNAIWIVFGKRKINPSAGKIIYIDDEKLEKLYNYETQAQVMRKTK